MRRRRPRRNGGACFIRLFEVQSSSRGPRAAAVAAARPAQVDASVFRTAFQPSSRTLFAAQLASPLLGGIARRDGLVWEAGRGPAVNAPALGPDSGDSPGLREESS